MQHAFHPSIVIHLAYSRIPSLNLVQILSTLMPIFVYSCGTHIKPPSFWFSDPHRSPHHHLLALPPLSILMPSSTTTPCVPFPASTKKSLRRSSLFSSLSPKPWLIYYGKRTTWIPFLRRNALAYSWFDPARSSILSVLHGAITIGRLTLSDGEGTYYYGRYHPGCNDAQLHVIDDNFWIRILL